MLADDFLLKLVNPNDHAVLEARFVAALFGLSMFMWLGGSRIFANCVLTLFALMQLLQLSHIAVMGRPLTPVDIAKIPHELGEIATATGSEFREYWPSLLAWGIPYLCLFMLFNAILARKMFPQSRWAQAILLLVLLSKPHEASNRAMPQFLPGPTRSSLYNSLNAFSYYMVKMAGRGVHSYDIAWRPYQVIRQDSPVLPDEIWLVIADSLRVDRLGFAGYARSTAPGIATWIDRGDARWLRGVPGAVSTGASLPLLINVVEEPGNIAEMRGHRANLMRLARSRGYMTHFVTVQGSNLVNDLDIASIDAITTHETYPILVSQQGDRAILSMLDRQPWGRRNFVVIMLRSTHFPYPDNYSRERGNFARWPDAETLPDGTRRSNAYDNSILYLDSLLSLLRRRFESRPGTGLFVFTSDHGELLGESGRWGHNVILPQTSTVPILLIPHGYSPRGWGTLRNGDWRSHYALGKMLAETLGYVISNPNERPGCVYVQGPELESDNDFREACTWNGELMLGPSMTLGQMIATRNGKHARQ
ncbi:MAG: sulfatase-like hydrolase/transferase [Proteobacteria bacterium]|nr:sulfatase-like hydrolase/transferase [Pseudomonadota bacterium]